MSGISSLQYRPSPCGSDLMMPHAAAVNNRAVTNPISNKKAADNPGLERDLSAAFMQEMIIFYSVS